MKGLWKGQADIQPTDPRYIKVVKLVIVVKLNDRTKMQYMWLKIKRNKYDEKTYFQ